jgi:sugar phosphate isomerase/epimerase
MPAGRLEIGAARRDARELAGRTDEAVDRVQRFPRARFRVAEDDGGEVGRRVVAQLTARAGIDALLPIATDRTIGVGFELEPEAHVVHTGAAWATTPMSSAKAPASICCNVATAVNSLVIDAVSKRM